VTPSVTTAPGEEKFFCYATSLPSTATVGVKSWSSKMTSGSHHMIVFASEEPYAPDDVLADTRDWEHPVVANFGAPFREPTTNKLTYRGDPMPKDNAPLSAKEQAAIRAWIAKGGDL